MKKDDRKFQMHNGKTGAAITVRVAPKAHSNKILEVLQDGTIKIRLTSPDVEEAANTLLAEFLGTILGVTPAQIEIVAGEKGKDKLVTIANVAPALVQEKILTVLSND